MRTYSRAGLTGLILVSGFLALDPAQGRQAREAWAAGLEESGRPQSHLSTRTEFMNDFISPAPQNVSCQKKKKKNGGR